MATPQDVIIVGAGAAGLACAAKLKNAGVAPLLIEARHRIGGRVLTLHTPAPHTLQTTPLEFGAEFIHGTPPIVLDRLGDGAIPFVDVTDDHLFRTHRGLKTRDDFFEVMSAVMGKLRNPRLPSNRDRTIATVTKSLKLSKEKRDLFLGFVEGFHAADVQKLGEFGLKSTEESDESELNGVAAFRLPQGYDRFLEAVYPNVQTDAHFNTEVTAITWRKHHVTVLTENTNTGVKNEFRARHCVITLPLGVLKSEQIEWSPAPRGLQSAITHLEMGHAMRIVFQFRSRFWESLNRKPVSYLHAGPVHRFPTW